VTTSISPERWVRFLEECAPGLTWLGSTLLEWAEMPPAARRAWRVTVQESRAGDVASLAALHEATGLLALAALPDVPPPFLAEPERVARLVGATGTVEAVFAAAPHLLARRVPGARRLVYTYEADAPTPNLSLVRAPPGSWEDLERMREMSEGEVDPLTPPELMGPARQGLVWLLIEEGSIAGMFRVEGVGRRRVQVTDVCVHPAFRGRGIGTALLRAAAHVARTEYARGVVVAVPESEAAARTAERAGYTPHEVLEDVWLAGS
jgi:ribosomal protein S18 acetylase RimI-like enzyme